MALLGCGVRELAPSAELCFGSLPSPSSRLPRPLLTTPPCSAPREPTYFIFHVSEDRWHLSSHAWLLPLLSALSSTPVLGMAGRCSSCGWTLLRGAHRSCSRLVLSPLVLALAFWWWQCLRSSIPRSGSPGPPGHLAELAPSGSNHMCP